MIEFADFVLRRNDARRRRRGTIIEIIVANKPIATYYATPSGNKINLHFDNTNPVANKMKELIRFKLAIGSSKPVVINSSQCTHQKCFQNLIDDFREEWNIFMNTSCKVDTNTHTQDTNTHTQDTNTHTQDTKTDTQNTKTDTQDTKTDTQDTKTDTQNTKTQKSRTQEKTQNIRNTQHTMIQYDGHNAQLFLDVLKRFNNQLDLISTN
jgi:hypothetical protein